MTSRIKAEFAAGTCVAIFAIFLFVGRACDRPSWAPSASTLCVSIP